MIEDPHCPTPLERHQKFLSFIFLVCAVVGMAYLSSLEPSYVMVEGKPVAVNSGSALHDGFVALIGILGMAGQALFRINESASQMNQMLSRTIDKLVPPPPADSTTTTTTVIQPEKIEVQADKVQVIETGEKK